MISPAIISSLLTLAVVLTVTATLLISASGVFCPDRMATLGCVHDSQSSQNSVEIDCLARFAGDEHNEKEGSEGERASGCGTMHHLTIEEIEAGKKKLYEAKVWVKPWLNFKELHEFKMPVMFLCFRGIPLVEKGVCVMWLEENRLGGRKDTSRTVATVVGGGNIFHGSSCGLDRSSADYIATMESIGISTRVQTAFRMSEVAEPYICRGVARHLEKGRVVIFVAGTANPFFTTDTASAL
ncbi:hypothetical protein DKX38_011702 [Salix brachista]|uniref:Cystatin domain-containing protein n=1 Tax=Salix brachista TaxID=2182728 RepID=A0A5N5M2A3_9ROSI|nr:hypothetical protein DKX38_011702 [Salix brachista]